MTPAQLAALTPEEAQAWALCEGATEGPWIEGAFYIFAGPDEDAFPILSLPFKPKNGRFVANARTSLPATLETIATLRAQLAAARQAIQRVREETNWCPVCDCHHDEPTEKCP